MPPSFGAMILRARTLISRHRPRRWLELSPAALLMLLGAPGWAQGDLRTLEILRLDCASELGRREVTLFGNGTLRLRDGLPGEEDMWLQELMAEDVEAYLARLSEETREETEPRYETIEGPWIERCALDLKLPGRQPESYEFGRYDSLSLDLRKALAIALELGGRVDQSRPPEGVPRLPPDYRVAVGDVLRRVDGKRYRVVGFTWDGTGVELSGIEDPLTLYVPQSEVRNLFISVERRRDRRQ